MVSSIRPFVGGEFARVPAHLHHQRRTVFAVLLRFYSSLDPAQVFARKTCLFSIRFLIIGALQNLLRPTSEIRDACIRCYWNQTKFPTKYRG